ncbi:MAG TPA: SDR family oxidoreductase, partial [Acidimicrobiales bacterium]
APDAHTSSPPAADPSRPLAAAPVARSLVADARSATAAAAIPETALDTWGRIDILVCCAGILAAAGGGPAPVASLPVAHWDEVIATNLRGTYLANRAVLPTMVAQGRGQIVNVASVAGLAGHAYESAYCASKAAVIGMTEALAAEAAPHGVRVQALVPGAVDTAIWDQAGLIPRPRHMLDPERVAAAILGLLRLPGSATLGTAVMAPAAAPEQARAAR